MEVEDAVDDTAPALEIVAEEVEEEKEVTEGDEDAIDAEEVEEVEPDLTFQEVQTNFAGRHAWVVSVKCEGSGEK